MQGAAQAPIVEQNPYEKMSFQAAFKSQAWKQHLEGARTNLPCLKQSAKDVDSSNEFSQSIRFVQDGEIDEEVIMSRFRDYLVAKGDTPLPTTPPLPGLVLEEFLNAFGPLELSFWHKLPLTTIGRVVDGEVPISLALSKQLSKAFGTRSGFWHDLQTEYDRRR
jgi:plasmid maintenance system antidote protein VapI